MQILDGYFGDFAKRPPNETPKLFPDNDLRSKKSIQEKAKSTIVFPMRIGKLPESMANSN